MIDYNKMLGFINVNKQKGVSSTFVVNRIKRLFKCKCGHMGTLDPLAGGVLPIGLGQATRAFDIMLSKTKRYTAEFDFSYTTPSLDLETEPSEKSNYIPSAEQIAEILPSFIGEVEQIPPSYSAKFVDGTRSYKLARRGVEVDLKPKKVTIENIDLICRLGESSYKFDIKCSGGTYIRSIVRDIAKALGVCGVMTNLTRTQSGFFTLENSVTLDELYNCSDPTKFIIKPQDAIELKSIILDNIQAKRLIDGLKDQLPFDDGVYNVFAESEFWGVGKVENGVIKMQSYIRDI